jgi:hypothetical protein
MKKQIVLFTILLFVLIGCAGLKQAANEVTPAQQAQMTATVQAATPFIPAPYQIPAATVIGYLACVAYNYWKDKTTPKPPTV